MPVTAKRSRMFYERLGEQITNELVEWFNQVDASYRGDLREINDLNYARFSAEMGQRFAEQDSRIEKRFAEFEKRFAEFEVRIERRFGELEVRVERAFRDQTRFLYLALTTQVALIAGLYVR